MTMKVKAAISAVCLVAVIGGVSVSLYKSAENQKAEQAALVLQQEQEEQARLDAEVEQVRIETMAKEAAERVEVERLALEKAAADEAARLAEEEHLLVQEEAERIAQEELANTAVAGTDWYTADDASQFVPEKPVQQEQTQPQVQAQQPSSGASNPTGNKQYTGSEITQEMLPPAIKWGGVDDGSDGHGAGGRDGGY